MEARRGRMAVSLAWMCPQASCSLGPEAVGAGPRCVLTSVRRGDGAGDLPLPRQPPVPHPRPELSEVAGVLETRAF